MSVLNNKPYNPEMVDDWTQPSNEVNKQSEIEALDKMIHRYQVVDTGKDGRVIVNEDLIHDYVSLFAEYQKLVIEKNRIEDLYDAELVKKGVLK